MLIRVIIDNVLSFGKEREFNMLPRKSLQTLQHHKYPIQINDDKAEGFELLKMAAIYGANGSGKTNLVQALAMLSHLVENGNVPGKLKNGQFKFQDNKTQTPQQISVEFVQDQTAFYYAVEITNGRVTGEELYVLGFEKEDTLIYSRGVDENGANTLEFNSKFELSPGADILRSVLLSNIDEKKAVLLESISKQEEKIYSFSNFAHKAFKWFEETLIVLFPESKPSALPIRLEKDAELNKFACQMMASFGIGIGELSIESEKIDLTNTRLMKAIEESQQKMVSLGINGQEILITKQGEEYFNKKIQLKHQSFGRIESFDLEEESDGTRKLLDFIPMLYAVIFKNRVVIIDEMERSLHPLLVKKLVELFSQDEKTKGQLIFTTHESYLLDQDIFRTDEIWFAEKDLSGATDLYALSAYKPHKTKDIETAYLTGRYGAIPFLGDLKNFEHSEKQGTDNEKISLNRQNSAE